MYFVWFMGMVNSTETLKNFYAYVNAEKDHHAVLSKMNLLTVPVAIVSFGFYYLALRLTASQ